MITIGLFDFETHDYNAKGAKIEPGQGSLEAFAKPVSLCWQMYDENGTLLKEVYKEFKPEDHLGNSFEVADRAYDVHKLSKEHLLEFGVDLKPVLEEMLDDMERCDVIVAHNGLTFDRKIFIAQCILYGLVPHDFENRAIVAMHEDKFLDTMRHKGIKAFVGALDKRGRAKVPSMVELYKKCFGHMFKGAHTADGDVLAMAQCVFALIKLQVLTFPLVPVMK